MDLALLVRAFALRDEHEAPEVRALTDRQVIDALNRHHSAGRPKVAGTRYADPTGNQAVARADRSRT